MKRPGCLWGLFPQKNKAKANPTGQWNTAKIIQKDGQIQFFLNGTLTAEADISSSEWTNTIAASNFKDRPAFGKATKGKIALQNWYFESWFRDMKIRELD
ncbi:DUF1080 domain-containing protein [Maribacter litopenaei]|uniref:DUF1080 domain-containing protein n=1 Tax=Maribacter litopenaei TaxID=2976127 RepID=A0ABY5YBT7_9FLAO|nr:DUF1080 domain-containing protein [Maribacter litopenaei]UWX56501.1 DUF1080 domain-containing protein [Maribacter litopenaei]